MPNLDAMARQLLAFRNAQLGQQIPEEPQIIIPDQAAESDASDEETAKPEDYVKPNGVVSQEPAEPPPQPDLSTPESRANYYNQFHYGGDAPGATLITAPHVDQASGIEAVKKAAEDPKEKFLEMLQGELSNRSQSALDEQRKGIDENQKEYEDIKKNAGTDFSALNNFVRTATGNQAYNQGYKPPTSAEELLKLKQALQGQRKDLSAEEIAFLKTKIDAFNKTGKNDRNELNFGFRQDKEIKSSFDKAIKDLETTGGQFKNLLTNITSGNFDQIKGSLASFAKFVNGEKGVLTDNDIGRAMFQDFNTKYEEFRRKFGKERALTGPAIDAMIKMTDAARKVSSTAYKLKIQKEKESLSALPSYENKKDAIDTVSNIYSDQIDQAFGGLTPEVSASIKTAVNKPSTLPGKKNKAPKADVVKDEDFSTMSPEEQDSYLKSKGF